MRILILFIFTTTGLFAQGNFRVTKTTGSAIYLQAYLNCTSSEMRRLTADYITANPSQHAKEFFIKFPILDSMDKYKKRLKYSMINAALLAGEPTLNDNDELVFTFKNGKKYHIKIENRIDNVYP